MNKYGKIWGHTSEIFTNNSVSIHRIKINAGSFCSRHYHQYRYNKFFVESGNIIVYRWDKDLKTETVLSCGESIDIPPNIDHQFLGLVDSIVYEIYYTQIDNMDIIRKNNEL